MTRARRIRRRPAPLDVDVMGSVANLFDAAVVFAAALLIALAAREPSLLLPKPDAPPQESQAGGEDIDAERLQEEPRFRPAQGRASGSAERLGVAYRLDSGEVVYVPE